MNPPFASLVTSPTTGASVIGCSFALPVVAGTLPLAGVFVLLAAAGGLAGFGTQVGTAGSLGSTSGGSCDGCTVCVLWPCAEAGCVWATNEGATSSIHRTAQIAGLLRRCIISRSGIDI